MIEIAALTKRYGPVVAVDQLSFTVEPGRVTGFLGPNGAGKSTTMRSLVGLDRPTSGQALINGTRYRDLVHPLRQVGALLGSGGIHPGRRARDHLRCVARADRISDERVDDVLAKVGLSEVGHRRVGGFSPGMRQRLGIGTALLGDPGVLLFDEPVDGLDPEDVRWIRDLMRELAFQGRTVLVSSHLMSEMSVTADHVVVIGGGRLILESSMDKLARRFGHGCEVESPQASALAKVLVEAGAKVAVTSDSLRVTDMPRARIGELAAEHRLVLHRLTERGASLDDAYLELVGSAVQRRGSESSSA